MQGRVSVFCFLHVFRREFSSAEMLTVFTGALVDFGCFSWTLCRPGL